ncbi:MAG: hypothetical protein WA973_06550 [Mesorhizobium sp.]
MADVRPAVESDVPALLAMGREFHAYAYSGMGDLDEVQALQMLRSLMRSSKGLVLTNGTGAIGGIMSPGWFQKDALIMEECFWWAGRGGRDLLREFVARSRAMGATSIMLSTLDNERTGAVDRIVRRFGFQPVERRYTMKLA